MERDAAALGPDVRPAVLAQELGWVPLSLTPAPPFSKLQGLHLSAKLKFLFFPPARALHLTSVLGLCGRRVKEM